MQQIVIKTYQALDQWYLKNTPTIIAIDTEVTSRNYLEMELVGISFCDGKNAIYLDLYNNPDQKQMLKKFNCVITIANLLIFHNAAFDIRVLTKFGVQVPENIFDTMLAAHLLDENNSCALKELAKRYLSVPPESIYTFDEAKNSGYQSSIFYKYALNDCIWTYQLYKIFRNQLYNNGLADLFYKIELPFQFVLAEMEINGVLADLSKSNELKAKIEPEIEDLIRQIKLYTGDINLNSPKQLIEVFKKLEIPLTRKTDKGSLSVNVSTLKSLQHKHLLVELLLKYRNLMKLYTTFIIPFPTYINSDGRIRTNFNNTLVTGRLSSSNPNLQQIPKISKLNIRSCFIAPEGKKLVLADFAGQELRVLAVETQDTTMLEAFNKGKDLHLSTANKFFDLKIPEEQLYINHPSFEEIKEKYKEERNKAKTINFGISYGKSASGFANDWNVSLDEAKKFIDNYFKLFSHIKEAIEGCKWCIEKYGFVSTFGGRKRHLKEKNKRAFRQGFNFIIQGTSADQMKAAAVAVRYLFLKYPIWDAKIILSVHDELVFEVDTKYISIAVPLIKDVMEKAFPLIDVRKSVV